MARDVTASLQELTERADGQSSRENKVLPPAKEQSDIPERTGKSKNSSAGQGGIAGPLIETAYTDRTFHATTTFMSTDGVFVLQLKPVKSIKFLDAANSPVTIEFKAKT